MRKQFVVIGLGRFGTSVAKTLNVLGHDVLAMDKNEHAVQVIMHDVTQAVQADARDEETLRALGVRNFDVAVVAIGDDLEANILITLMLKEMGIPYVVAKAQSALHGKVLEKIGADKIIFPEQDMGIRLANNLVRTNVMDFIELSLDFSIFEIIASAQFVNKTLGELDLRAVYQINVAVFFFLFMAIFAVATILLSATGLEPFDAMSAVAATLGSIGPGFGVVGATTNYSSINAFGEVVLILCMLLGRLELFTLLVVLQPEFWRSRKSW